jgi:hypothetical protein
MSKFILGVVVGIAISTVGINGIVRIIEKGVDTTKNIVQETAK